MKKNTYTIPLALVFSLFFLWAISSNLLPTMIRQPRGMVNSSLPLKRVLWSILFVE